MIVNVNGIRLAYSDTASGRPVVLLVHRFPLNRSMWDWENAKPVAQAVPSPALPVDPAVPTAPLIRKGGAEGAKEGPAVSSVPPRAPHFYVAASEQACTGEDAHG